MIPNTERKAIDGTWQHSDALLHSTLQTIFHASPTTFNCILPTDEIIEKRAARRAELLDPNEPLGSIRPDTVDVEYIRLWGHLRDKARDPRFPPMATNTSVLRDLVGNAYLRQYGIDIISWPLGRFKYFANVSLDIAQNPRTYTLRAGQLFFTAMWGTAS